MRFRGPISLLLVAAGCSTALSSINDADLSQIRIGHSRADVEKIVGGADGVETLPSGRTRVTYNLVLDRPQSENLRWDSVNAAGAAADALGSADWDCLAFIPAAIVAGTFVVAEGIAVGKEVHRLCQGNSYRLFVEYDASQQVRSKQLQIRRPESRSAKTGQRWTSSGQRTLSEADLSSRWRAAQRGR